MTIATTFDQMVPGSIRWLVAAAKMLERRSMEILWRIEMTPEMAARLLANHNLANRRIIPAQVAVLVDRIRRGAWHDRSEIRIDTDGQLLDGQHRLAAIVAAGHAVSVKVLTGCDREREIEEINQAIRKPDEQIKIVYGSGPSKRETALYNAIRRGGGRASNARNGQTTSAELREEMGASYWGSIAWAAALPNTRMLTPISLRVAAFLASEHKIDRAAIEDGWNAFRTGTSLQSTGLIPFLRDRMLRGEEVWAKDSGSARASDGVQVYAQSVIMRMAGIRSGKFQALHRPAWPLSIISRNVADAG